jgi:hypothetical protein
VSDARDYKDNALSRIYREGSWPEPSRQIDEAILAASRRAARERWPRLWRWGPPFALAATVVVTGSLVLMSREPEVGSQPVPDTAAPIIEEKSTEKKPAPVQAPAPPPQVVATPQGFTSTMDLAEAERLERAQRDLGLKQSPPSESPLPTPAPSSALKKETPEAGRADLVQRRPETPQALRARQSALLREEKPSSAPISVFGAQPPGLAQEQASKAEPAPAPPQAAPSPATLPSEGASSGAVANALSLGGPSTTSALSPGGAISSERTPLNWLEDIRRLKVGGRAEEAAHELAEFRKRYPEYPLPNDLR